MKGEKHMTKHGKMIADVVLSSHAHPTAEQIYLRINESGTKISMATVYNNLKTLVEEGVLRKITLDGSPDRFDRATSHQHLICARCGRLSDIGIRDLTQIIEEDTGLSILNYDLHISYLCESCRADLKKIGNEQV